MYIILSRAFLLLVTRQLLRTKDAGPTLIADRNDIPSPGSCELELGTRHHMLAAANSVVHHILRLETRIPYLETTNASA
ncbi:hypothetical protein BJX66DRAFT_247034 [Aspergillus keveii]|jgi:hypothetical protein|uniref:Secreted protein n=1 Tax=Aspergillus keveii TaxID=714993 RepID=A0ABR4G0D1_9EURO